MNLSCITRSGKERGGIHRLSFFYLLLMILSINGLFFCKPEKELSALATEGKGIYMANCIACHNVNPKLEGAVGPSVGNSSFELLETRMKGEYPPGYTPKRQSQAMTRFNLTYGQLKALEEYLKQ